MGRVKSLTPLDIILLLLFTIVPFIADCAKAAPAPKPIEVNYVTFQPRMVLSVQIVIEFLNDIEKLTNGQIKFVNRGGPEAIPPFDQAMAVKGGAVDMSYTPVGYYAGLTAAPGIMFGAQTSPMEDRNTGAYALLQEIHEKAGLIYLTRWPGTTGAYYQIMLSKEVKKPEELARLVMAGGSFWDTFAAGLKMKTVGIPIPEWYSAMERGIIHVAGTAPDNFVSLKFWEVAKYTIYPAFGSIGTALIVNPKKWKSIPQNLQQEITDAVFKALPAMESKYLENHSKARKELADKGVKSITFTGADAEFYLNTIYKSVSDYYIEKAPVDAPKLLKTLQK